jgi:transcriptional regulator with XRE-family HTH domain
MTVKDYLKKKNISQSLLARAAGIAPSILTKHLRGQPVSPVTAARLELATDGEISAMEVLYGSHCSAPRESRHEGQT